MEHSMKRKIMKYWKIKKAFPALNSLSPIANLFPILEKLADYNCLTVTNNFEGTDITPSVSVLPTVLRRFEIGVVHSEFNNTSVRYKQGRPVDNRYYFVWAERKRLLNLSKSSSIKNQMRNTDNINHFCPTSTLFASLNPFFADSFHVCVGLNQKILSSSSKLWQCQIQLDLLIPEHVFRFGKVIDIFGTTYDLLNAKPTASARPTINILVQYKESVLDYDTDLLINWIARQNIDYSLSTNKVVTVTNVYIYARNKCKTEKNTAKFIFECNITNVEYIAPCFNCPKSIRVTTLKTKVLSMDYLLYLDSSRVKDPIPGSTIINSVIFSNSQFSFIDQIANIF